MWRAARRRVFRSGRVALSRGARTNLYCIVWRRPATDSGIVSNRYSIKRDHNM